MKKRIICFGKQLRELIEAKGLSASMLAKQMGFSSRTTVFRVLRDETSYDKLLAFYHTLQETASGLLTESEFALLRDALEVNRVGVHNALCNQAVCALLTPKAMEPGEILVETCGQKGKKTLSQLMEDWVCGGHVEIEMTGCCEHRLFKLMRRHIFKAVPDVSVIHYISSTGEDFIEGMAAVQPVLYCKHYTALHISGDEAPGAIRALYSGNVILVCWQDASGELHREQLTMTTSDSMLRLICQDRETFEYPLALLHAGKPYMTEIKTTCPPSAAPEDYVRYTAYCAELERKREIYAMKPDIPISYIHPDILWSAMRRFMQENGQAVPETMDEGLEALYRVHLERWENYFGKSKVTHTVLSYPAMRRFAETGELADQFFALCPYTKEERLAILQKLRTETIHNPYFTIYFVKEGYISPKNEISLYEGRGVLFNKGDTDYRFDGDHAEALVIHPEFCSQFRAFYLGELLVNAVESKERTLELLDQLIEIVS